MTIRKYRSKLSSSFQRCAVWHQRCLYWSTRKIDLLQRWQYIHMLGYKQAFASTCVSIMATENSCVSSVLCRQNKILRVKDRIKHDSWNLFHLSLHISSCFWILITNTNITLKQNSSGGIDGGRMWGQRTRVRRPRWRSWNKDRRNVWRDATCLGLTRSRKGLARSRRPNLVIPQTMWRGENEEKRRECWWTKEKLNQDNTMPCLWTNQRGGCSREEESVRFSSATLAESAELFLAELELLLPARVGCRRVGPLHLKTAEARAARLHLRPPRAAVRLRGSLGLLVMRWVGAAGSAA